MDFREKIRNDRMAAFSKARPPDITEEAWDAAKRHAETNGQKLSKELEQSCFYYYSMGDTLEEVSSKLEIPLGMLAYTALHYDWHKRKFLLDNAKPGSRMSKAETAAADLVADAIVATAAVYRHMLADVIKNPEKAEDCPLIPRNVKEMQVLLQLLQVSQPKSNIPPAPAVNVNIANMGGGQAPQVTATQESVDALPVGQEDDAASQRLNVLKMLQQVRMTGG